MDANGVLFDLPDPGTGVNGAAAPHYSFPVLTGISAGDPLSTRAARMRIYLGFMAALDATGEGISHRLSEVDLSNPEDIKAIIPDTGTSNADILVHFGEEKFLERYHQYQEHLAEWRAQYPKLASVDMRYERQVVLQMQPGTAVPTRRRNICKYHCEPLRATTPATTPRRPVKASTVTHRSRCARKGKETQRQAGAQTH